MLTVEDAGWLNAYHRTVYNRLSPLLSPEEKEWLAEKTENI
jgi:Xaa-Pro aminopeptidase